MVYFVLLLCCLGGLQLVSSAPQRFYDLHEAEFLFEKFMKDHDKNYANDEEKNMRFEIFKKSVERVNEWNRLSKNGVFGNVEAQYAIKHNQLIELSESQLVDCDSSSNGCVGGLASNAMSYLVQAGGSMSEQDYPYQTSQQSCKFDRSKVAVTVTNFNEYNVQSEHNLVGLVGAVGPIAFGLDGRSFSGYHGGILDHCPDTEINHAVLLVGFGTENGIPYWLVKNSYGTSWGEQGYIRLKRGVNMCGMMQGMFISAVLA